MDTAREQRILLLSIGMTVAVSAAGFMGGLLVGSQAILFDGIYSLVDVALTLVSLSVLRLVAREQSPRFQYGYWHLEPMVEALGGVILSLACVYALANAVIGLTTGGHVVKFGPALWWAGLISATNLGMAAFVAGQARRLHSPLLWLDVRAWLLGGLMALAVVLAFLLALALQDGPWQHWVPYLDSIVLLLISLAVLPVPTRAAFKALREVLQVAPDDLDQRVQQVMQAFVRERGYAGFTSHVAKMGRMRFIEIHVLTDPATPLGTVGEVDAMRDEIAVRLDARGGMFWLTIDFTADPAWT
ncbi:cation diffusion facilitator family transporter [Stenotrophomonas sp.]|uniref:cation diffusion facilitator family transporter n=1 Tax=Stenotrophomonas sp. TaxID=69392 RepID=UPI0031E1ADF4